MSAAEQFLDDAEAYIARGHALLAAGKTEELPSLDVTASKLSAAALPLLAELKASHGPRFSALLRDLEAFVRELQANRGETTKSLGGLEQLRRAGIAYATRDASDKKG